MACIIHAICNNVNDHIWKKITNLSPPKHHLYYLNELYDDKNFNILSTGFGIFVEVLSQKYVVTCYHIIGDYCKDIYIYANDKDGNKIKINMVVINFIKELDIVILGSKIKNELDKIDAYTEKDICWNFQDILYDEMKINALHMTESIEHIDANIYKSKIEFDHLKSYIIPKIPLIRYKFNIDDFYKITNDIEGLSGTILTIDNKIAGITTSFNGEDLEAIPFAFLINFIKKILINPIKQLRGIHITSVIVDIQFERKQYVGHYISVANDIYYKKYNINKLFIFKNEDIIFKIDDTPFENDGTIEIKLFNYKFPIQTYIMYNDFCNDHIKINIIRKNREKKYNIEAKAYENVHCLNIVNKHEYLYWNGMIFTELSEELIFALKRLNIKISNNMIKLFNKYSNENIKKIILIDIDYLKITKTNKKKIKLARINLTSAIVPYIKNKIDEHDLLFVDFIDDFEITSIKDMSNYLSINPDGILHCRTLHYREHKYLIL